MFFLSSSFLLVFNLARLSLEICKLVFLFPFLLSNFWCLSVFSCAHTAFIGYCNLFSFAFFIFFSRPCIDAYTQSSTRSVGCTPTASQQRSKTPPTSVLDITLNNLMVSLQWCQSLGNAEYPFIAIALRSILALSGSTWSGPIYGLNRTKLCTYAKLNCLKWSCFWHWNCTYAKLICLI